MSLPHSRVKVSIVGSLRDREIACSASDRQSSNFESCVWRTVSSQKSHHPQEVLLAQFSLYVHKGGLKPDSFHFHTLPIFSNLKIPNIYNIYTYQVLIFMLKHKKDYCLQYLICSFKTAQYTARLPDNLTISMYQLLKVDCPSNSLKEFIIPFFNRFFYYIRFKNVFS